jgi:inner membrane protein
MDSVTQFLLGASVSGAVIGPKMGIRALLIGGIVATLPDLDAFVPMGNAIDTMTHHRGATHSVLMQTLAAPVIAFAVSRFVADARANGKLFLLTVWLCLVTHSLLDSLTTYGTQILWPLEIGTPAAYASVFIIDPLYSVLVLVGLALFLVWRRQPVRAVRGNRLLLLAATIYLGLGMVGHGVVMARAKADPAFAGLSLQVQPTPFNIVVWQVLGIADDRYVVGLTNLTHACPISSVSAHPRLAKPPAGLSRTPSVQRFEWFTDGFYSYQERPGRITVTDLRLGFHPNFAFSFDIAEHDGDKVMPIEPRRVALSAPRTTLIKTVMAEIGRTFRSCPA